MQLNFQIELLVTIVILQRATGAINGLYSSRYLNGRPFRRVFKLSFDECLKECVSRGRCDSVNFCQKKSMCELNLDTAVFDPDELERKPGWFFSRKESWNQTSSCPFCQANEKCEVSTATIKNGSVYTRCIATECPQHENKTDKCEYNGNIQTVGARVTASCITNTLMSANNRQQTIFTCSAMGTWIMLNEYQYSGRKVFRAFEDRKISIYQAWTKTTGVVNDSSCLEIPRPDTCKKHYRHDDFYRWESLKVSHVKFSIFKNYTQMHYIVFNGTNTTVESWFDKERILESSWTDISTASPDMVSIKGDVRISRYGDVPYCYRRRRFLIGKTSGDCETDSGWFLTSLRNKWTNATACCAFDLSHGLGLWYSKLDTFAVWNNTADVDRADYVDISIVTDEQ